MAAFDPRDRGEVGAARGNPGYSGDRNAGGWGGRDQTNSYDSRRFNSRYAQNPIATRPGTFGNIATALGIGAGFGPATVGGILGGHMMGIDPYSGPAGSTTGYSYDGPNRAGAPNFARMFSPGFDNGKATNPVPGFNWPGAPGAAPAAPPKPLKTMSQGPMQINIPGGPAYGLMMPGYKWFV